MARVAACSPLMPPLSTADANSRLPSKARSCSTTPQSPFESGVASAANGSTWLVCVWTRRRSRYRTRSMHCVVTRRALVLQLSSWGVALAGCGRLQALFDGDPSSDERFLSDKELVREPLVPAAASFSGVLKARRFMSYAGCADQGTTLRWLVLERSGIRLPLRIVTASTLTGLRAGDEGALENDELHGEALAPEDASRQGVAIGQRVKLEGVCVALHFSGTLMLNPVFGLCTKQIIPV